MLLSATFTLRYSVLALINFSSTSTTSTAFFFTSSFYFFSFSFFLHVVLTRVIFVTIKFLGFLQCWSKLHQTISSGAAHHRVPAGELCLLVTSNVWGDMQCRLHMWLVVLEYQHTILNVHLTHMCWLMTQTVTMAWVYLDSNTAWLGVARN